MPKYKRRRHVTRFQMGLKRKIKDPEKTYTRAPENIPAAPTPAIARPMIKATDVGAAPHTTRMNFSTRFCFEGVRMEVKRLPEPTSKMNIAVK